MFFALPINLKIRLSINFIQKLTQTAVFPFMTLYFAERFGATLAGVLMLFTAVASFLASLYGGYLSDRFGRKRVLLHGELVRFATLCLIALFNSPWIVEPCLLFLFFLVNNVVSGLITPANEAILIDDSTAEDRKFLYTLSYWSLNAAIVIGSIVGGYLYSSFFFHLIVGAAVASLGCFLLIRYRLRDTYQIAQDVQAASLRLVFGGYRSVFSDRPFALYLIAGILLLSLELQLTHYLAILLSERFAGEGARLLGLLRSENTVLVLLLSFAVLKWTKRFRETWVLYTGAMLFALGFALLPLGTTPATLFLGTLLFTLGELMYVPIHQALLARLTDERRRSQYIAANGLRYRGALLLGALSISIYDQVAPFVMSVVYVLCGAAAIRLYTRVYRSLRPTPASECESA